MGITKISFADYSWNPIVGCSPIGAGCKFCWAERLHAQRHEAFHVPGYGDLPIQYQQPFSTIQLRPDRLEQPLHWKKPRTVFVNSMSDTFHEDVSFSFVDAIMQTICKAPQHTYFIFTKRYELAFKYFDVCPCPPNIHIYFSASTQAEVDKAGPVLLDIPAAVRGLSLEPLIGLVDLRLGECDGCSYTAAECRVIDRSKHLTCCPDCKHPMPDRIIVGCESGPRRRPCKLEWIRSIVEQCQAANVKVYVKQMEIDGKVETDMSKFPEDLRLRNF